MIKELDRVIILPAIFTLLYKSIFDETFFYIFISIFYFLSNYELNKYNKNEYTQSFWNVVLLNGYRYLQIYSYLLCVFLYSNYITLEVLFYNFTSLMVQGLLNKVIGGKELFGSGKTFEGYFGGLFFTHLLFKNSEGFIIINVLGILNNLFSTYLKYRLNILSYSNLLGSLGGFTDVMDSFIFPLIYCSLYTF